MSESRAIAKTMACPRPRPPPAGDLANSRCASLAGLSCLSYFGLCQFRVEHPFVQGDVLDRERIGFHEQADVFPTTEPGRGLGVHLLQRRRGKAVPPAVWRHALDPGRLDHRAPFVGEIAAPPIEAVPR